jgi:pilus assembly protein TadC
MTTSRHMVPVALLAVGSVMLIVGSVVGAVSGTSLVWVCVEGLVGVYSLSLAIYLFRKRRRSGRGD